MGNQIIITKPVVVKMVSLLEWCYRLGVESAYNIGEDEGLVREFLETTGEPGVYGFLREDPLYMDWQEWTLRMSAKARMSSWNGIMKRYLDRMGMFGSNYLSVYLPLTQIFHNRGVEDYLSNPHAADISQFDLRKRVWWTPKGLREITLTEWVEEMRMLDYDLQRRDAVIWETLPRSQAKRIALTARQHEMFRERVGLAMLKPIK